MRSADTRTTRLADRLVLAAFALCLAGSSIYVPYPLRPFHWGLAFFVVALAIAPSWRIAAWHTRLKLPVLILVLLLALQSLWVMADDRYTRYTMYLLIGAASAILGETIARRPKPFLFLFPGLLAYWFITAYFPAFDTWTEAQRFRPRYLLTGGVWNNINDMATALVFANLIWLLCRRRLSLLLFGACWFYALLLNRRADMAAALVLGIMYLVWLVDGDRLRERLKFLATCVLATLAALPLQSEPLHLVSLPTIQATAPPAVPSPGGIPPTHVAPPVMAAQPAMTETPPAPASGIGQTQPPAPTLAPPPGAGTHVAPAPLPETHHAPPPAPTANVSIKAQDGDESSAFRARLTMDMVAEWRAMPWWQWLTGLGAGQLNLIWPGNKAPWASPHFFWLEMFFHVGLGWFLLLGWLMWRLDWRGRISLLVAGIAGLAPSSMVYFQPFWIFLGVLAATLPTKRPAISQRAVDQH
ncbi:Uncharacterised protein [Achromobacter xylosoxidans]|uniref:hypothetical protein n=1 Tax=Alcaligenes xylosoxydans xylosoxydans TaxID=85698 RepID=UPI0006C59269|nr:hypothetical protein [Achromobacter xylosoxidans]QEQ25946.1 hypothetical protein F0U64_28120 [Achromobacter xylosoxidans]CUJ32165.1 Uncharacterised protein [Achromobacter xylosoxidans]